jgi:heat-inducible transcriptional repressor
VPTNAGYRYYVERLMAPTRLPNAEARTIRHQFHQIAGEQQGWLRLAATVMASRMHNVGLITPPRASEIRMRHLEVISIQGSVALVIVVLQDGTVLQEMLTLPEARTQEELSSLADALSMGFKGLTSTQVEARATLLGTVETAVASGAIHLLRRAEAQHAEVVHAGLTELLRQPEFSSRRPGEPAGVMNERLQNMVNFLHQGFAVQTLISSLPRHATVQVVIGEETAAHGLEDYSFVLGRYGDSEEGLGFLGVVGPTRMAYPQAIALVRYMTALMNDLMDAY